MLHSLQWVQEENSRGAEMESSEHRTQDSRREGPGGPIWGRRHVCRGWEVGGFPGQGATHQSSTKRACGLFREQRVAHSAWSLLNKWTVAGHAFCDLNGCGQVLQGFAETLVRRYFILFFLFFFWYNMKPLNKGENEPRFGEMMSWFTEIKWL